MAHNPMGKDPADYESEPIFNATTQKSNMVNTRTGLFEAYIKMPAIIGNSGNGPVFEMNLFYSPLTNNQAALGDGWEFSPTLYSEEYERLTLHSGETLSLKKGKNLNTPTIDAEWDNDGKLKVRRGGRVELLSKLEDTLFYFPEWLTDDGYNKLHFNWIATPHIIEGKTYYQTKLQSIRDGDGEGDPLIEIEYTLANDTDQPAITPVTMTYWPTHPAEKLRYQLNIEDYALTSVVLADDIQTKLEYLDHETAGWLLNKFTNWDGLVEVLLYNDNGLSFPDNPKLTKLPCVNEHYIYPSNGVLPFVHRYEYDRSDRFDYYITTEFHEAITEYKYDYNTNEIVLETVTRSSRNVPFIITTSHTISADSTAIKNDRTITYRHNTKSRKVEIKNRFNQHAALIENIQPGKATQYNYDPPVNGQAPLPRQETQFSLSSSPGVKIVKQFDYDSIKGMSEQKLSQLIQIFSPYNPLKQRITYQHIEYYQENSFRKGKPKKITQKDGEFGLPVRDFNYALGGTNNSELTTTTTESIGTQTRVSSSTQSVLSGRLIRQVDTDGNRAEYTYDAFGRLATLTLCAQSPTYKQITAYTYPAPGQVMITEANGQVRLEVYDGQDRLLREYDYPEPGTQRLLKEVSYDNYGREKRSTQYDYHADGTQLSEWSEVVYDGWGEVEQRNYSSGRRDFNHYDPIAMTRTEWSGTPADKHRKVTTYNEDETIKKVEFRDQNGAVYQTQTATYTEERLLEQLQTDGEFGVTTITYTRDSFGRVLTEAHVEDDKGLLPLLNLAYTYHYTYPAFSPSNEPETIDISFSLLGLQRRSLGKRTFDAWGRVTSLTRGDATETYTYIGASTVPASTKTADGLVLKHEYIPELGNKLSKITNEDGSKQKTFSYAHARQNISTASEGERILKHHHDSQLRVTQQHAQTQPGKTKEVSCSYSPAGRLLSDTDVFGATTKFLYNSGGQRTFSKKEFVTSYTYNDQGLAENERLEVKTDAAKHVDLKYEYDAQQREIMREFHPVNTSIVLKIMTSYYSDGRFKQVQLKGDSDVLGSRSFTYTAAGRLKSCTTTGVWRPQNPKGKLIDKEEFTYDALGNVSRCVSTFAGARNIATYTYDSSMGVRLEKIENTHADYTKSATLTYDAAGRISQDQKGRKYHYDWLGHLTQIGSKLYSYAPDDSLMTVGEGPDQRQLIYREGQLNGEYAIENDSNFRQLQPGSASCIAQQTRISGVDRILYEWRDLNGTVCVTYDAVADTTKFHAYTAFGEHFFEDTHSLLGYQGEYEDATNGQIPLGERVYLPQIRQFHAPDTSSPFGIGGPHAYGYCVGNDPINFHDPSGHFSVSRALRNIWGDNLPEPLSLGESGKVISTILFSGIGVLTAIMTAPASLIVAAALAALTSAVLAVTAVVIAESHPEWSQGLAWASLFFGIASGATALIKNMPQRFARLSNYLGNTTRTVGKNVFRRTAAVSPAQKIVRAGLGELPENMDPISKLRLIEPYQYTGVLKETPSIELFQDFNTLLFGVTGVLSNTGALSEMEKVDGLNTLIGNGTWLPNGSWHKLWTSIRK